MSKRLTRRGEAIRVSLDPLTRVKLAYAVHVADLLGQETNISGVVRAAIEQYVRLLGERLQKLSQLPAGHDEAKRLTILSGFELRCAHSGTYSPWADEDVLRHRLSEATRAVGPAFPTFSELQMAEIKQNSAKMWEEPYPGGELQRLLEGQE